MGSQSCVIRIRYNISTGDLAPDGQTIVTLTGTSALNGANSPLKDRQATTTEALSYRVFQEFPTENYPNYRLGTEVNTNQYGRGFQDRSYMFSILPAPTDGECAGRLIYNLNIRGKVGLWEPFDKLTAYEFNSTAILSKPIRPCQTILCRLSCLLPTPTASTSSGPVATTTPTETRTMMTHTVRPFEGSV